MRKFVVVSVSLTLAACGTQPAPTPKPAPNAAATPEKPTPIASVKPPDPTPPHEDPEESAGPITMEVLLQKPYGRGAFPKATIGDRACWQGIALSGQHRRDYDEILTRCGTPTGLVEYAKPVRGRLHHVHDKRDVYVLKLQSGLCYRYFAVADGEVTDLDILVQKPNGALVADDKTRHPVAIIDTDKPWCMDEDAEYHFLIEVDGPGNGGYVFAVWARPK